MPQTELHLVVAKLIGRSCIWTVSGRWRVTRITARSVGRRLSFAWFLGRNHTWVVTRLIGKSCTWTAAGRWRVTWITARSVGQRLSFAWCLRWNYTWVLARLIGRSCTWTAGKLRIKTRTFNTESVLNVQCNLRRN